jgi:hypothetical protein
LQTFSPQIKFNDSGDNAPNYKDSIEEITNIFNEKEYKEAKAIILSTVYKE